MAKKMKYLSAERRELVLWVLALQVILDSNRNHFKGKELTWIDSTILSVEVLSKLMLGGLEGSELRAVVNVSKQVNPILHYDRLIPAKKETVKVDIDLLYDLAESAVALCEYDCNEDFENCPRRKMFLDLLVPPYTLDGPCQYWQKGEA